jgi:cytochrome c oxidase subunit 2
MFNVAYAGTLPLTGSDVAARWDSLYIFLVWLSVFFFILVVGGMIYFAVVHRHRPGMKTKYVTGNHTLEALWIAIPTLLLMIIFGWGYSVYHSMTQSPPDAFEIRVVGKQWLWTFQYDDGRVTTGEVFVPVNQPVKFIMSSEDVLHSFFVPSFRVKQDVIPGMYSSVWFTPTVLGKHQVYCAEYCGTSHSGMLAKVIVLDDQQWKAFRRNKPIGDVPNAEEVALTDSVTTSAAVPEPRKIGLVSQVSLSQQGKEVYETKGCVACHSVDGSQKIGPSHKGLYQRKVELADGRTVVADDNYIRGHIENPRGSLVKGYNPVMPTFKGLITETEMNALMAYLKSIK